MSICDPKAFTKYKPLSIPQSTKDYCDAWISNCKTITSPEDQTNCLIKFGETKNANSCLNLRKAQYPEDDATDEFIYSLKSKYDCLSSNEFPKVDLDYAVYDCLALSNHYE